MEYLILAITILLLLVLMAFVFSFVLWFLSGVVSFYKGAPFVPVKRQAISRILKFGGLKNDDSFVDLGSGDGRVLTAAVIEFNVTKATGYEAAPWPYLKSKFLIRRRKLHNRLHILRKDFFNEDLSQATFIYMYLFPKIVNHLAKKLGNELATGSRILSIDFKIDNPADHGLNLIKEGKVDKMTGYLYQKI